jgi:uncharacterized protein (DUF2249 family)
MNMVINPNTKIASILKHNPAALEAIVSISPKFEKLRNPILRKLMAGRASVSMASKIGGCRVDDLFAKLEPLGFEIDHAKTVATADEKKVPVFIQTLRKDQIIVLDVRPMLSSGRDPLSQILEKIRNLKHEQVLKILNSFEPTPLMLLLQKQGFESYAEEVNDNLVETWFYRKSNERKLEIPPVANDPHNWDEILSNFKNKLQTIDVRSLEMPLPMLTILEALDKLPAGMALYVYHKRIPVFLLPELAQRQLDYRIKEIADGEVHLLIYRTDDHER